MSLLLATALAASLTTTPSCSWNRPGADPFMGSVVEAVDDYRDIPTATRTKLRQRIAARQYDDLATISREAIVGKYAYLPEIRDMHFGQGRVCTTVTRARWPSGTHERGLVYCEDGHCIIVPTVCRNVSRVTRVQASPAAALGAEGLRLRREPPGAGATDAAPAATEVLASAGAAPRVGVTAPLHPGTPFAQPADAVGPMVWVTPPAAPAQPTPGVVADAAVPGRDDFTPAGGGPLPAPAPGLAPPTPPNGGSVPQPISPWVGATGGGGTFLPGGSVTPPIPEPGRAWYLVAGLGAMALTLARRRASAA
jgi:hypothetical protein